MGVASEREIEETEIEEYRKMRQREREKQEMRQGKSERKLSKQREREKKKQRKRCKESERQERKKQGVKENRREGSIGFIANGASARQAGSRPLQMSRLIEGARSRGGRREDGRGR